MSSSAQISAIAVCLTLGTLTPASSAGLPPPFNNYGAKFTCGTLQTDADDVIGVYATAINIHNPQAKVTVPFLKKFVVANQEGQGFREPVLIRDVLKPDTVEYVDCPLIYKVTKIAPGTHIDGFIVLQVPPVKLATGATLQPELDVVGKYTSRGLASTTGNAGLEIVTYGAKRITF